MKADQKSRRYDERVPLTLTVSVWCRESEGREWHETTRFVDVTRSGARLALARAPELGQLLHLTTMMPESLRSFDLAADEYKVWAVVRNIRMLPVSAELEQQYQVGVAFVGKNPPDGFKKNPTARYDLRPTKAKDGMWVVRERPRRNPLEED